MKTHHLINRLSFRQLQVFLAVYDQKSFSKAGELLGLTQPAVSSQIRLLEEATGSVLFDYIGKKLYCTLAGEKLAQSTRNIFYEVKNLHEELAELEGEIAGELRIVGVNTAQYIIPYLLKPFLELYPKIKIHVNVVNRSLAIKRLEKNTDDIVIMGMVPDDKPLTSIPFLTNELVAVARADHPIHTLPSPTLKDFLSFDLLLREPGSGTRLSLEEHCKSQRVSLQPLMELGSNDIIKHAVIAGLGIALLPKLSIIPELKLGTLKIIQLPNFPLKRSWCMVHPKAKHPTSTMRAFIDFIQQHIHFFEQRFSELANLPHEN